MRRWCERRHAAACRGIRRVLRGGLPGQAGHWLGGQGAEFELQVVEVERDMQVCDWLNPGIFRL